jgi:hypothetical protein
MNNTGHANFIAVSVNNGETISNGDKVVDYSGIRPAEMDYAHRFGDAIDEGKELLVYKLVAVMRRAKLEVEVVD